MKSRREPKEKDQQMNAENNCLVIWRSSRKRLTSKELGWDGMGEKGKSIGKVVMANLF